MIQLREKLSKNGLLALRALHDLRVISAHWTNPGYEELKLARLCASYLSRHAHKQRRLSVKERARQMCREMGKPIPEALR